MHACCRRAPVSKDGHAGSGREVARRKISKARSHVDGRAARWWHLEGGRVWRVWRRWAPEGWRVGGCGVWQGWREQAASTAVRRAPLRLRAACRASLSLPNGRHTECNCIENREAHRESHGVARGAQLEAAATRWRKRGRARANYPPDSQPIKPSSGTLLTARTAVLGSNRRFDCCLIARGGPTA